MTKIVTSSWRPFLWIEAITLRSSLFSKVNHEFPVTPPAILWDAEDPFEIRIWNKVRGSQCPHQTLCPQRSTSYRGPGVSATQWLYQVITINCPFCRWGNRTGEVKWLYEVPTASMWQSLGLNPGNLESKLRLLLWSEQWSPARLPDLDSEMLDQHRITLPFTTTLPRAMYWDLVLQKPKMSFPKAVFNLDVPQDTLT